MQRKVILNQKYNEAAEIAVIGTGFWSNYQIPAWKKLEGVEIVSVCDHIPKRAEEVAGKFGLPKLYNTTAG